MIRLRIIFDDARADRGEDFIVFQVFDPSANQWVEVSKDVADDISGRAVKRPVAGGFTPDGMYFIAAVPRRRLGPYAKYVVEWVDKLPPEPILINEGVRLVYKGSDDEGDYFEVVPL